MTKHSAKTLRAWARDAERGASIVYFVGDLCTARADEKDRVDDDDDSVRAPVIEPLALAAEQMSEDEVICLVQRRLGMNRAEYIAQRTRRPYHERPYGRGDRPCNLKAHVVTPPRLGPRYL